MGAIMEVTPELIEVLTRIANNLHSIVWVLVLMLLFKSMSK